MIFLKRKYVVPLKLVSNMQILGYTARKWGVNRFFLTIYDVRGNIFRNIILCRISHHTWKI